MTTPGTGGSRRLCPAVRGRRSPGFDHVMSLIGMLKAIAMLSRLSPWTTRYAIGLRLGRLAVGMDTGLMIVLSRPRETSPIAAPSLAAAALTLPAEMGSLRSNAL